MLVTIFSILLLNSIYFLNTVTKFHLHSPYCYYIPSTFSILLLNPIYILNAVTKFRLHSQHCFSIPSPFLQFAHNNEKYGFFFPFSLQSLSLLSRSENKRRYFAFFVPSLRNTDWQGEGKNSQKISVLLLKTIKSHSKQHIFRWGNVLKTKFSNKCFHFNHFFPANSA